MEERPGYHTTGRSAAFYAETYGGAAVQPLTTPSKGFFENPPPGFADAPSVGPRGGLHMAEAAHLPLLQLGRTSCWETEVQIVSAKELGVTYINKNRNHRDKTSK